MAGQDGLTIDLLAGDVSAGPAVDDLNAKLGAMEAAFNASTDAISANNDQLDFAQRNLIRVQENVDSYRAAMTAAADATSMATAKLAQLGPVTAENAAQIVNLKAAIVSAGAEEEKAYAGFTSSTMALARQRISMIQEEAAARNLSVKEQIAALTELKGSLEGSAAAVNLVDGAITRLNVSTGIFNKLGSEAASVGGSEARMFSALGSGAGAAAGRVAALVGSMDALKTSALPLLVVLAAFTAAFSAFSFLKDGAESAAQMQDAMDRLKASVESQNESWANASKAVQDFINVESIAAGVTKDDLVSALDQLVARGAPVADAITIVRVAEEEAIATHKSLSEVTNVLMMSEGARASGLLQLDPRLKDLIKSHGTLSDALRVLHGLNKDQITDADGEEMSQKRAHVATQAFAEMLGKDMLPAMKWWNESLVGALSNAEALGKGIGDVASGIIAAFQAAGKALADFARMMADAESLRWGSIGGDLGNLSKDGGSILAGNAKAAKGFTEIWGNLNNGQTAQQTGHGIINEDIYKANRASDAADLKLIRDLQFGNTKTKSGGSGSNFNPPEIALKPEMPQILKQQSDAVQLALDGMKIKEGELSQKMEATTTVADYQAAKTALLAQKAKDANEAVALLTKTVSDETVMHDKAQQAVTKTTKAYEDAYSAYDKFGKKIGEHPTKAQSAELRTLATDVTHAKTEYDRANATLTTVNATLQAHRVALNNAKAAVDNLKDAAAELDRKWDAYYTKQRQNMAEDLATSDMTNAQKYLYFKQLFDQQSRDTVEGEAEAERLYGQELAAYKAMLKDQENALKSFSDKAISYLDKLFQSGKNGTNMLSQAFQDMIHAMEQALEKSALMSLLGKLFGINTGSFGSNFSSSLLSALGMTGMMGATTGGASAKSAAASGIAAVGKIATPQGTGLLVHVAGINPGLISAGGSVTALGITAVVAGALGIGGGIGALEGAGTGAQGVHATNGALGGLIGAGGAFALAAGGGLGALGLGASGFAGLGGYGLAAMMTNPMGIAILLGGALLGGALGGAIGPHWGPATNYPDRSDTQNYGQFVTDINGQSQAQDFNGTKISAQPQYNTPGTSEGSQMVAWAQANPTNPLAQQILGLGNSGADLFISNERNGMFTLADGKQISVTDFEALGQQFQAATAGSTSSTTPVYNVTHSFPDWLNPAVALGGNYTPGGPNAPNAPGLPGKTTGPVVVKIDNINVPGIVGITKDDLVTLLSDGIGKRILRQQQSSLQSYN